MNRLAAIFLLVLCWPPGHAAAEAGGWLIVSNARVSALASMTTRDGRSVEVRSFSESRSVFVLTATRHGPRADQVLLPLGAEHLKPQVPLLTLRNMAQAARALGRPLSSTSITATDQTINPAT